MENVVTNDKDRIRSRCAFSFCTSSYANVVTNDISFFKFPNDPVRCSSWVEACSSKYLPTADTTVLAKKHRLCSKHFESKMFSNFQKNRLFTFATPTLFENIPTCPTYTETDTQSSMVDTESLDENDDIIVHCSTPDLSISQFSTMSDVSTSTDIDCASTSSQTPSHLSLKTPRKIALKLQLAEANESKRELEKSVLQDISFLEQDDKTNNISMNKTAGSISHYDMKKIILSREKNWILGKLLDQIKALNKKSDIASSLELFFNGFSFDICDLPDYVIDDLKLQIMLLIKRTKNPNLSSTLSPSNNLHSTSQGTSQAISQAEEGQINTIKFQIPIRLNTILSLDLFFKSIIIELQNLNTSTIEEIKNQILSIVSQVKHQYFNEQENGYSGNSIN